MDLHFGGTKPPRPDSAGARPDTPPIPTGRRGDNTSRAGGILRMKMRMGMKMNFYLSLPLNFWANINSPLQIFPVHFG